MGSLRLRLQRCHGTEAKEIFQAYAGLVKKSDGMYLEFVHELLRRRLKTAHQMLADNKGKDPSQTALATLIMLDDTLLMINQIMTLQYVKKTGGGSDIPITRPSKSKETVPAMTPELGDPTQGISTVEGGKVISHFASLLELLRCLRDFVHDHKSAHGKLYLQRDISIGNLLIFEGTASKKFGRLVDYDHAKKAAGSIDISCRENFEDAAFFAEFASAFLARRSKYQWKVKDDVALEAVACVRDPKDGGGYLFEIINNDPSLAKKAAEGPLSMDDLRWGETETTWPDFVSRVCRRGERTGTLPFMSAEVIGGSSLITPGGFMAAPPFTHQAIHDMESLFWVFVHLCMTRKGPGMDMRRDELNGRNPDDDLSGALVRCFDGDKASLLKTKGDLLRGSALIEDEVITYFHPYFHSLKPVVWRWWKILILGYRYRAKEFYNIHAYLIRTINEAIALLPLDSTKEGLDTFNPHRTSTPA
ncbi:hypothetical protein H0H92_005883 [Tricholoma furcatifolium]|nr:hypothetical protein H0H92_005883 [Tricholoma furcatifolium]